MRHVCFTVPVAYVDFLGVTPFRNYLGNVFVASEWRSHCGSKMAKRHCSALKAYNLSCLAIGLVIYTIAASCERTDVLCDAVKPLNAPEEPGR